MSKLRDMRMAARQRDDWSAFTIDQLCKVLSVTAPTYYRLENDPKRLTYAQAELLAEHYGCKPTDFFCATT